MKLDTSTRKKYRIKKKLKNVAKSDRFRLSVSRSTKNISAQIIDDINRITLLSASSVEKDVKNMNKKNKTELSKIVAEKLAKKAIEKKSQKFILIVVFISTTDELKFLLKHLEKMEWNFNDWK